MRRIRFDLGVTLAVLVLVLVPTVSTFAVVWIKGGEVSAQVAGQIFSGKAGLIEARAESLFGAAAAVVEGGALLTELRTPLVEEGRPWGGLAVMRRLMARQARLYSLYAGYPDGRFLQVILPRGNPTVLAAHQAPAGTAEIDRAIVLRQGRRVELWHFLDGGGRLLRATQALDPAYDPRRRDWYTMAQTQPDVGLSGPYLFGSLRRLGVTVSRRLMGGGAIGADFTLDDLAAFVRQQAVSPHGVVFLLEAGGRLLVAPQGGGADLVPALLALRRAGPEGQVVPREVGGVPMLTLFAPVFGGRMVVGIAAPRRDFSGPVASIALWGLGMTVLALLVVIPLGSLMVRLMSRRLTELAEEAERITEMDFSGEVPRQSVVTEFSQLGRAFGMMKDQMLARTRNLEAAQSALVRLLELGIAVGSEKDMGTLVEKVVLEAERISGAEGGTLFLLTPDGEALRFAFIHNRVQDILVGGAGQVLDFELPTLPFTPPPPGSPDHVVCAAIRRGVSIHVADVAASTEFDFTTLRECDARAGYHTRSLLVVPLRPRGGEVIGAIQLVNAHERGRAEAVPFAFGAQRHVKALAAQAANALHNRILLDAQDALVDAMVRLIAGSIDAKSPYTGGHCERVPLLAQMLAEEAARQTEGPLADFAFTSEEEWREFRVGAWLHDCGKVTTPEYVVDKATKLETLHNRIHEIRTRFEVLLRDAEIARLQAVAAGSPPEAAAAAFARRRAGLEADFAFVAECNIGGEAMAPERLDRLRRIAGERWQRHFSDRLGLSFAEQERLAPIPAPELPVWEPLLADRPEHVIPWSGGERFLSPQWKFTLPIPAVMYNRGEVHNLSILRGTLTGEERFKVSEHVIQTLMMLESLPFPKHLRRVPEYAGAHHETMDGKGYPRSLSAPDLSIPSRIMAIADIFEALTASDRPYKKAKPLSACVAILAEFRDNGHIDPVLFDLFLRASIYRRYAERHLMPHQLDEVDVTRYLH